MFLIWNLVEISPNASPPVCKILDFGKFRYEIQKKQKEAKKKQKVVVIKEIKLRPTIDTHDYEIKAKAIKRFLGEGDKVKVSLRFRGREMAHQAIATELFQKLAADIAEFGKVESEARMEGKQLIMVLAPK
ncbi:MAG: translation initiation factor IF-3 [Proteobacteria bacterium]|nr:translation initiation factor IF-3 [Pseudomonadota bacterium]